MRIVLLHNYYKRRGGECAAFDMEVNLLRGKGHEVHTYTVSSEDIGCKNFVSRLRLGVSAVFADGTYGCLRRLFRLVRPDVVHIHNFFPLISPAAYYAAGAEGVPVVQTLHNYRLLCEGATFFRERSVCEECLGKGLRLRAVARGCYQRSRAATAAVALMITAHRLVGTWAKEVSVYIALTEFAKRKFVEGGLPAERLLVKPNFVDPDPGPGIDGRRYALFLGRLSSEKGVETLLECWSRLAGTMPLKIAGDGPLADDVVRRSAHLPLVEWLGQKSREEVYALLGGAAVLVLPSEWYETFGLVAIEAFARGTPVLCSRIGALAEIVDDRRTGLHFRPGDPEDLAEKVEWAFSHPAELAEMGREARAEFEAKYTAERNYRILMEIYERALGSR